MPKPKAAGLPPPVPLAAATNSVTAEYPMITAVPTVSLAVILNQSALSQNPVLRDNAINLDSAV